MKSCRICWLLFLLGLATTRGETLTLATYNLENYGPVGRMTESGYHPDYPKPESEKAALRQAIRAIGADVLVVQEMGTAPYLEELAADLKAEGLDYPYRALLDGADEVRHLAVLSRRPFASVVRHADLTFAYFGDREPVERGLLEVTFETAAGPLAVFAVHLKSRLSDRDDDPLSATRRTGEATAVRNRILREFPDPDAARFLIVGDCNDSKDSRALQRLERRGGTEISRLVPARDSRGETWTYHFSREDSYSRFDHILVSPGLQATVAGGIARIYDGPGADRGSDHRPVVVTLDLTGPSAAEPAADGYSSPLGP